MIDELIETIQTHKPNITGVSRQSAVLLPLILRNGEWHLLYEKRSMALKTQPGEICFPGGSLEDIENSEEAAIRETCEELGLSRPDIEIVGQIDSILTSFDMLIHCYVGKLKCKFEEIRYSKEEVDTIFSVPIAFFLNNPPKSYMIHSKFDLTDDFPFHSIPNGKDYNFKTATYPIVFYDYEGFTIWGLTARMTQQFVDMIREECKPLR